MTNNLNAVENYIVFSLGTSTIVFVVATFITAIYTVIVTQKLYKKYDQRGDSYYDHYAEWQKKHRFMPVAGPDVGFFCVFVGLIVAIIFFAVSLIFQIVLL